MLEFDLILRLHSMEEAILRKEEEKNSKFLFYSNLIILTGNNEEV